MSVQHPDRINVQLTKRFLFTLAFGSWAICNVSLASEFSAACEGNQASGYCQPIESNSGWVNIPPPPEYQREASEFGTYEYPFSVNSLWNSHPRQVKWASASIPTSIYFPKIGPGNYSLSAFKASASDRAMRVHIPAGRKGVWDPDAEAHLSHVDIVRWPASTVPATGSDGHADIVDPIAGEIHSFFQLRKDKHGRWTATQYAWTKLNGRGWGDAAHYFQGARAAAVPSMAGLIRKHEINDGASLYYHALAMSLTYNGLSGEQQYMYPATSGDTSWQANSGEVPMGALMMLPPDFDASSIANPQLRKVVNTLKTYGAYVVDRNVGTPFYIYVENGVPYDLHNGKWNTVVGQDLHRIRAAMRQVANAQGWVNGVGKPLPAPPAMNKVSMRGQWRSTKGSSVVPRYDSRLQRIIFGATKKAEVAENASGRIIAGVKWAKPIPGRLYEFRVEATSGGRAYLRYWGNNAEQFNTRALRHGETYRFYWPKMAGVPIMGAVSGIGSRTEIRATLTEVKQ